MSNQLATLEAESADYLEQINNSESKEALDEIRVKLLGKSGVITQLLKSLGKLDPEVRKEQGVRINHIKVVTAQAIEMRKRALDKAELDLKLMQESVDVTLPVRQEHEGSIHPTSRVIAEVVQYFAKLGFDVATGPQIEDDEHNFTALNIPEHHPARQSHDTFYLDGESLLLRTHTSPVQIRWMKSHKPPVRILAPGRTYRCDYDATHTPMFHQVEGLVIDESTNFAHLKSCLMDFLREFFEDGNLPVRFRPSFFPFTEPSAEVDIGCSKQGGQLKIGSGDDWLEILGCGMVHPNVLINCGLDPEKYQGFAFGMGVERLAMLKYGMPDIRPFFDSDQRWLRHYRFSPFEG